MFATPFTAFHTLLSLAAIVTGACVMSMLVKNRRPDVWTLAFLATMIATDVTGFMFPFTKLLPSHYTGIAVAGAASRSRCSRTTAFISPARGAGSTPSPWGSRSI